MGRRDVGADGSRRFPARPGRYRRVVPLFPGDDAPTFTLPGEDGDVAWPDLARDGRILLAFYKGSCPTCQLAFPFLARLEAAHGTATPVVAVAQDPLDEARAWLDERGFGGHVLDDRAGGYAASAAYDLDSVPTLFLVEDGRVTRTTEGWDREEIETWDEVLADRGGTPPARLDLAATPVFKPG